MRWIRSFVAVALGGSLALGWALAPGGGGVARADATQSLVDAGSAAGTARGTTVGVAMFDRRTGVYSDNGGNARLRFGSASIVKLFIADSVLRRASRGEITLAQADRDTMGLMLRSSDDAAASNLWSRFGYSWIVNDVIARYALTETAPPVNPRYWGVTQISAHDMTVFYARLLSGDGGLPAADRDWMVSQLRQSTATGTDGVHQWFGLHDALPGESVLGIKQGWMCCNADGFIWRHSTGLVGPDARYVVVVLTRDPGSAGSAHTAASATRVVQTMFPSGRVPRVQGAISDLWYSTGGHTGPVGLPVSEEAPATGGAWQLFQRGRIYWSPRTDAHWITGAVLDAWVGQGSENAVLGYPTSNELALRGGAWQLFQGGRIYWSPNTGARWTTGGILAAWAGQGSENGRLGYPSSNEQPARGGAWQAFQGGRVYWSPNTGAHWLTGGILTAWGRQGSETGPLGYPSSDEQAASGGAWQQFQGGRAYWSPSTDAHWLSGAILQAWIGQGSERGSLGYPTSDPYPVSGGTRVDFRGGSITVTPTNQVLISGTSTPTPNSGATTSGSTGTATPSTTAPSTPTTSAPTTSTTATAAATATTAAPTTAAATTAAAATTTTATGGTP